MKTSKLRHQEPFQVRRAQAITEAMGMYSTMLCWAVQVFWVKIWRNQDS